MTTLARISITAVLLLIPTLALGANPIVYRYQHHLFTLDPNQFPTWRAPEEIWLYDGQPFKPPAALRVDGDVLPSLPQGIERASREVWDLEAIRATLQQRIAAILDREPGAVTISRTFDGAIAFDGVGLLGRRVDLDTAARLTVEAMKRGVGDVVLPMIEQQPQITVNDSELQSLGIAEVVSIGESDFRGSPGARTHNIDVGLSKFNGHLIPKGAVFSFNEVLGPVDAAAGYKKELVIQGDKTLPDYGGGLCQVSTTAYRGAWEYGFPIDKRLNHSYAVRYYAPAGTDATIYPPAKDVQFTNDTPGAVLIQTYDDPEGFAYFIYYGTRDDRTTQIIGPYTWGSSAPPPDRLEYTTDIPPGTTRKVGERVPGLRTAWFRIITDDTGQENVDSFYSIYEARPLYTQVGVEPTDPRLHPAAPEEGQAETENTQEPPV